MQGPITMVSEGDSAWRVSAADYGDLIEDAEWDSRFIRRTGLLPNLLDLLGNCADKTLLDVGTGTGWLFDFVQPALAYACDIVPTRMQRDNVHFSIADVQSLPYDDETFDTVVASLVLFYCRDLQGACEEIYRVTKSRGGKLTIALMHPYFYRMGAVSTAGGYCITEDLSKPAAMTFRIADRVGPLSYFYRPLPDYVNTLIGSGWVITEMRDWSIDMALYSREAEKGMKGNIQRTGRVPLFSFINCIK